MKIEVKAVENGYDIQVSFSLLKTKRFVAWSEVEINTVLAKVIKEFVTDVESGKTGVLDRLKRRS